MDKQHYNTPDGISDGYYMAVIYGDRDAATGRYMVAEDSGDCQDMRDAIHWMETRIAETTPEGHKRPGSAIWYRRGDDIEAIGEDDIWAAAEEMGGEWTPATR